MEVKSPKVAFIVSAFSSRSSGPRNSVTLLAKSVRGSSEFIVDVYSDIEDIAFTYNELEILPVSSFNPADYDLVLFSGVFRSKFLAMTRLPSFPPYIISPRGSLVRLALLKSSLKKLIFLAFGGYRFIKEAVAIHFLTEQERSSSLFFNVNSFVVPNIVKRVDYKNLQPDISCKVFGYWGRIDVFHKGLDLILKATAKCPHILRAYKWKIRLVGEDYRGGVGQLLREVEKLSIEDLVEVVVADKTTFQFDVLSRFSVFLQVSRFEGQPQGLLEALAFGLPSIVTPGTNMHLDVVSHAAGWSCRPDANSLSELLSYIVQCDSAVIKDFGLNAKVLVDRKYRTEIQGRDMASAFRNLIESD